MKWCICEESDYKPDGKGGVVCVVCGHPKGGAGEFKIIPADPKQIDIVKEIVHQNTMILKGLSIPPCFVGPWDTDKEE